MNKQLFRKKSIDRVTSPEQLDEYIRVANPGVWTVLLAIVVLLAGVFAWCVMGRLETIVSTVAVSDQSVVTLYAKETEIPFLHAGMEVRVYGQQCVITQVSGSPVMVEDNLSEYALHVGDFQSGEWCYAVQTDAQLPEGTYAADVIVESAAPISFLLN